MAETLRELVVRLSVDSEDSEQSLRGIGNAVRQAEAEFRAAGAGVKGYEKTLSGAQANVKKLTQVLSLQEKAVAAHQKKLAASKKALEDNQSTQQEWAKRITDTKNALEAQAAATGENSDAYKKLEAELKKLESQQERNAAQSVKLASEIQRNEIALTNAEGAVKKTSAALDSANKDVSKAEKVWNQFANATKEAQKNLNKIGDGMIKTGKKLTVGVSAPIIAAGTAALKASIDWETAFTGVTKTVDGTEKQLQALHDGLLEMSKEIPISADNLAKIAENAGQLGIETDSILGFTRVMADLGNTTNLSADDAAMALARFAAITQMSQKDFDRLGSTVVALGNNYATTESEIVDMASRLAAAGKQVKMSESSIMGLATALSSLGLEAEGGGTALSKVMLNIDIAAAEGGKEIKKYADIAGVSAKEFSTAWKTDPAKALNSFILGLSGIEEKGGNVALTLEKLGYSEVRARDAILRLAGSSDVLGKALVTANGAWAENNALTKEADKRYGTTASKMQVLKNKLTATGISLGNTMAPALGSVLETVDGIIAKFGKMNEAEQQTMLTLAAVAAGTGPVLTSLGSVFKASSSLMKFMSGPAGWITVAVAGMAALGVAVANVKTPLQKIEERLADIKFDVSEEIAAKINSGISAGVAAADKEYSIKLKIDAEVEELAETIDTALEDGKFIKKEYTAIKKQLDKMVKTQIDEAKADLETSVTAYVATLEGLKNADGSQIISDTQIDALAQAMRDKTQTQIDELKGLQTQVDDLMKVIYDQKEPATAAQMAELDALLKKIAGVRAEIQLATDEAVAVARSNYNLTVSGRGTEESAGIAMHWVAQEYKIAETEAAKARDAQLLAADATEDTDEKLKISEAAWASYNEAVGSAADSMNEKYTALLGGIAKGEGIEGKLAWLNKLSEYITTAEKALEGSFKGDGLAEAAKAFGEGGALERFTSSLTPYAQAAIEKMLSSGWGELSVPEIVDVEDALEETLALLKSDVAQIVSGEDMDVMSTFFQSMFDMGGFKPEDIDITKAEGTFAAILNLIDLTEAENQFGYNLTEGIGSAIEEGKEQVINAVTDLVDEAGDEAKKLDGAPSASNFVNSFITQAGLLEPKLTLTGQRSANAYLKGFNKIGLGIASPSKEAKKSAMWFSEGFVGELHKREKDAYSAGIAYSREALFGMERMQKEQEAIDRHMDYLRSRGLGASGARAQAVTTDSRTYSTNATLRIDNYNVNNEADTQALMAQMEGITKRRMAGYGARTR